MTITSSRRYFLIICFLCICFALSLFVVKPYLQRGQSFSDKRKFGQHVATVTHKDLQRGQSISDKRKFGQHVATVTHMDVRTVGLHADRKHVRSDACSPSTRICSTTAIRNCAVARNYFPKENQWTHANASFPGSRFLPTFCRYKHNVVPPASLQRCLQNKPIRHIVVIGDSHGGQYFKSLQALLKPIADCKQLRENTTEHYFSRPKRHAKKLPKQKRHEKRHSLWECAFVKSSANTGGNSSDKAANGVLTHRVLIELITIITFGDNLVPGDVSHAPDKAGNKRISRKLFDTLFGEHFGQDNRYPDIILFFSNSHDKGFGKTLNKTRSEIKHFRDVVNRYVPRSTSFYWFNHLSENDLKKKSDWQSVHYEGKYTANEMIIRTNRAMYDVLRDDVRTNRIHTFFDLHAMTLPLADWSRDGIHLKKEWYVYLTSYWFQTVCSTFM